MPNNNRRLAEYGYTGDLYSLSEESGSYLKTVIEKLHLKHGDRVLDLGCGAGNELQQMKNLYGARIFGADISDSATPGLLRKTKNVAISDAASLPFRDGEFDFIHSKDMFVHMIDYNSFFKEGARVLKDGGKMLLVSEMAKSEMDETSPVFYYFTKNEKLRQPVADWQEYVKEAENKLKLGYKVSLPVCIISEEKCLSAAEKNGLYKIEEGLQRSWFPKPDEINWNRISRSIILFQKHSDKSN